MNRKTAILQVQTGAGNWKEVGRCLAFPQIMAVRLDHLKAQYKTTVRAVDNQNMLLDMR